MEIIKAALKANPGAVPLLHSDRGSAIYHEGILFHDNRIRDYTQYVPCYNVSV